jgi:Xaa-Pro aminopeptidase
LFAGLLCVPKSHGYPLMLLDRLLLRTHATLPAYVVARSLSATRRAFHFSPVRFAIDMEKVNTTERLAELRKLMKEHKLDVYSTNPPQIA